MPQFEVANPFSIEVTLAPELSRWFSDGAVLEEKPSRFRIRLNVNAVSITRQKLDSTEVTLGYHLLGGGTKLFTGNVSFKIPRDGSPAEFDLPNPQKVSPRNIQLFLAN